MRWYSERQNLKQNLVDRSQSRQKAQSILRSLANSRSSSLSGEPHPDVDMNAELAEFDRNIYMNQQEVEKRMTVELKALGVPFFGTSGDLIKPEVYHKSEQNSSENKPKWSPLITEKQLLELRRKMIDHLETLYRD